MSSTELFALAKERERAEEEQRLAERKARVAELRAERRTLVAGHRKALSELNARIAELSARKATKTRRGRKGGLSAAVLGLLEADGELSVKAIKGALEAQGLSGKNINQTLAYLKRTGRIESTGRGVYKIRSA
jgi:sRNA-binding protein